MLSKVFGTYPLSASSFDVEEEEEEELVLLLCLEGLDFFEVVEAGVGHDALEAARALFFSALDTNLDGVL